MCCGTSTMCASCKNGNITPPPQLLRNIDHVCKLQERQHHPPTPCVAEHPPCVQVVRTVTSPPHPSCCVTSTMCASCKNGNITPPTPCVAEHPPCVQVVRTVTSPPHPSCCGTSTMCANCKNGNITHPPHVLRNVHHVCKL